VEHKKAYTEAFDAMKQDREMAKKTNDLLYVTFDLQKTLPLPHITMNIAFYLRQIWLYNVGIHVESKTLSKPFFHIWTEAKVEEAVVRLPAAYWPGWIWLMLKQVAN